MSSTEANQGFFANFLDDYFAECDEHLTVVRCHLLDLEQFVHQPNIKKSLLEELFRSFHSLKGLSGMVGVKEAEQLAHQMESYLRSLREQQVILTPEGIDVLCDGTKLLEQAIATYRTQSPAPDIQHMVARLEAILANNAVSDNKVESVSVQDRKPSSCTFLPQLVLKQEEREDLAAALENGAQAWQFQFVPEASLTERGVNVNNIRERLQAIGQIIHAAPRVLSNGGIAFDFLIATQALENSFACWSEDGLLYMPYSEEEVIPSVEEKDNREVEENLDLKCSIPSASPVFNAQFSIQNQIATPSNVVRVDLTRLDELMQMVGELVITRARLENNLKPLKGVISTSELRVLKEINLSLERQLRDLREGLMRVRLVPIGEIFTRMQFVIRDLARESQKQIALEFSGQGTEIDKFVVERMMDPLLHLVRNAVSHGLESETERLQCGKPAQGKIFLRASTCGEMVTIEVEDDGRGVDVELVTKRAIQQELITSDTQLDAVTILDILCSSGFSTREEADLVSGRGVGMAAVKKTVLELGGFITLNTQVGLGTRFTIQLPLTLAIADALIISVRGQTFAIPQSSVREVLELQPKAIAVLENNEIFSYRGSVLPLIRLADMFGLTRNEEHKNREELVDRRSPSLYVVAIGTGSNTVGILVDGILGQQEIVVRPLTDPLVQVMGIAGATELGDRRVVLILDTAALLQARRLATWKGGKPKPLKDSYGRSPTNLVMKKGYPPLPIAPYPQRGSRVPHCPLSPEGAPSSPLPIKDFYNE
ncbi:chemotaxis protein CheA [Scytonema hofmannii]|uniref:chemotaxis protein CheA n=1 Tax=Scytonema hofmannii TaxID=34078 RepID=UPI000347C8F9|nr:chemotaxis protein CheA [Scytonema hofmannii]